MDNSVKNQLGVTFQSEPVLVPIDSLRHADSPRLDGENADHIRALADMNSVLPPILVHRATMRVVDGMHRLRAAVLNGRREISARFVEGSDADVFVAAVLANIGHGLPLSLSDREAAAARILTTHPEWSDRAIAEAAGLAATTVARIRGRMTGTDAQPAARIGKDGRVRPINGAAGRRLAGRLFAERPGASLREIAEAAGISPATAKDVRARLGRGEDPVPAKLTLAERKGARLERADAAADGAADGSVAGEPVGDGTGREGGVGYRGSEPEPGSESAGRRAGGARPAVVSRLQRKARTPDAEQVLRKLLRDPSLRLNDNGRVLLRWLSSRSLNAREWESIEDEIPAHCVPLVADLALGLADEWTRFGETLRRKARSEMA